MDIIAVESSSKCGFCGLDFKDLDVIVLTPNHVGLVIALHNDCLKKYKVAIKDYAEKQKTRNKIILS